MPRKKTTTATPTGGSLVAATAILNFFRTAELSVALFAAGLVADTIKERQNKGKAVIAGRAKGPSATDAVNAATASAIGTGTAAATGPTGVARKKPGPAKGTKRKKTGTEPVSQAADAGAVQTPADEVTDAGALPPQEGSLDLG